MVSARFVAHRRMKNDNTATTITPTITPTAIPAVLPEDEPPEDPPELLLPVELEDELVAVDGLPPKGQ